VSVPFVGQGHHALVEELVAEFKSVRADGASVLLA
jgi:hypothetical protein